MTFSRFQPLVACLVVLASARGEEALQKSAFAAPSPPSGKALFSKLSAAATGLVVENAYDDPEMWGNRYRAFMGGGMGSGVAAGDFDGDGKVDLYVSTKTKPGRLFKNLGNWRFEDVTEKAGLSEERSLLSWMKNAVSKSEPPVWRQGAVFADVDNDGFLDLYICRNNAPNLLYINQRNGTFKEEGAERGLNLVDGSVMAGFADFDRDGWLDAYVVTNQIDGTERGGRPNRLFRNTGQGRFVDVTGSAGIKATTFGHAATWFDYNEDGWPDIYICNDFSGPDYLYRNNKDGTFTNVLNEVVPHTPYSSMGADAGDINNDGHIDLLIADMATTTREKDRRGLAASRDDMLRTGANARTAPQYMRNALLLNTGAGVFGEAACWAGLEATDWTWSVRFEDFDNDGWIDLHVTNGMVREANNADLLSRMMRALSDQERINVIKKSPALDEENLAYKNIHGTSFQPVTELWGLGERGVSFGAATADFDNDGDLDLAYINYNGGLSVFQNNTTGSHRAQIRLHGTRSNRFGVGAVVRLETRAGTQSRTLIAARGYASGSELVAHFGLGLETNITSLTVEWPSGIVQRFSDLPADNAYTITENNQDSGQPASLNVSIFQARGAEVGLEVKDQSDLAIPDREQAFIPFRTDRRGPGIAVADVDGDGHDDIYLAATTGSPARMLRWANGHFIEHAVGGITPTKVEDGPALFMDVDGNGTRDLLVTKSSARTLEWPAGFRPVLYSNDGHGAFTATDALPELSINVGAACAADIDGDGDLDLFLGARSIPGRYPDTPQSALLRNDHGHYTDITAQSAGLGQIGLVKSALFRDVDGDGRSDLIVAVEWDYVRYFHNDGAGAFSDQTEKAGFSTGGRGWWNGLACADFNRDGRPDFAVGNLGLNTTYRASPQHPALLYSGDFSGKGTRTLAEAVYDGGQLFPLRSRADISTKLPSVLRRYPNNNDFARATLADVYGDKNLAAATLYKADNFASGVFLSQPDGGYRFEAFPREAQIGPMQGIVAGDLDGDGLTDVCAVQNFDGAMPHFDGGVGAFLKGKGEGKFEALPPKTSGVVIPGNAKALVLLDEGDHKPSLFLTRHGDASEYLSNRSDESRWLEIKLIGAAGNPDGIGSSVTLEFSASPKLTQEIGLGDGWLSQSSPVVFAAVPPGETIVAASVRWPDGTVTRHAKAPAEGVWLLRKSE
ncbi:MAG TPA: FG-GAP-like repeat-containing protein [Opitutaceae bacterium]|nr:FG-GAP-like repeat-containing protein [Opitutaceae bacterium]